MKAPVITAANRIELQSFDIPTPGATEVRIRIKLAGICGTDNSLYRHKVLANYPIVPGHEAVGVVDAVGAAVSSLRIGQRVTIHPNDWCGECALCRRGLTNICANKVRLGLDVNGVFTDYVVVSEKTVFPVPDSLPDEIAVFTEPLTVSAHGVRLANLTGNERVLVFGAGVIGQLALQLARLKTSTVCCCDLVESRLAMASKMGATETVSTQEELSARANSFDVIFETSGAPSALQKALELAAPGGTIVLLGISGQEYPITTVQLVRKELKVLGSMIYSDEFASSIDLLEQKKIDVKPLISGYIGIEELADTFEHFSDPARFKTLVRIAED